MRIHRKIFIGRTDNFCRKSPLAKRALTRIVCVPTESLLKFTKAKISLSGIFASAVRVPLTRTLTFSGTLNTIIPSARLREASGIANSFSTIGFCSLITYIHRQQAINIHMNRANHLSRFSAFLLIMICLPVLQSFSRRLLPPFFCYGIHPVFPGPTV